MNINQIKKYKKYMENGLYDDGQIEKLAERYSQQCNSAISQFDVLIHSDRANTIYKNNTPYKCIVDYGNLPKKSGLSNLQHVYYREVITKISDGITAGDIVDFSFDSNIPRKKYLFIKTIETREEKYHLSIMQECNSEIKWVDDNGTIRSFPCIFLFNSRSNFGVRDDRTMSLADGRRQVIVQNNDFTKHINRDIRFIFQGDAFKVIDIDTLSEQGIVNIILKDDQFDSATDNKELGVANYFQSTNNPVESGSSKQTLW